MSDQPKILCDNCKSKPAEVFYSQIAEGKLHKVNLCKGCSKEKGVEDPTGFALGELLLGMGENKQVGPGPKALPAPAAGGSSGRDEPDPAHRCPACGFTQADFKKTGRLGCSECYPTFADSLAALLKAMHKGTAHTGKVPARVRRQRQLSTRVSTLRQDLERAVRDENYEGAANLRDQIRQIETQLGK